MKKHISYALGVSLSFAMLLGGCNKQTFERSENDERLPVRFSCATLSEKEDAGTTTASKVTGNSFDEGDRIGLFAYPSDEGMFGTGENVRKNVLYLAQGGARKGQLSVGDEASPIFFPTDASKTLNFKGYYPYSDAMTADGKLSVDVADQSKGQTNAILYSDNAKGIAATADFVKLEFRYVMAQVVINIQYDQSIANTDVATISAVRLEGTGLRTSGELDMALGEVTPTTAPSVGTNTGIAMVPGVATTRATVVPGKTRITDLVIRVVTPRYTYVAKPKDVETGYEAGKQYIYNVTLKGGGEAEIVGTDGEATILPWEPGNDSGEGVPPIIGEQEN